MSDDVTLTPETLERLRAEVSLRASHQSVRVPVPELSALLDTAARVQQVEAERDKFRKKLHRVSEALSEAQLVATNVVEERDALQAKLDKVRELLEPAQHYMHSRLVSQALEVLNGR